MKVVSLTSLFLSGLVSLAKAAEPTYVEPADFDPVEALAKLGVEVEELPDSNHTSRGEHCPDAVRSCPFQFCLNAVVQ